MFPYSDSRPFWDCGQRWGGRAVVPAAYGETHNPPAPYQALLCTHLHDLQLLLGSFNELGNGHIDELVLCLCLHHARALSPHHLDGLLDVNVTVQPWAGVAVGPQAQKGVDTEGLLTQPPPTCIPHKSPSPLVEMLSMSMSMTMMVPVRPMPALGREGGTIRGPGHASMGKGSPSIQLWQKWRVQREEVTCPGSRGTLARGRS